MYFSLRKVVGFIQPNGSHSLLLFILSSYNHLRYYLFYFFIFVIFAEFNNRFISGEWCRFDVNMILTQCYNVTPTLWQHICLAMFCEFRNFIIGWHYLALHYVGIVMWMSTEKNDMIIIFCPCFYWT